MATRLSALKIGPKRVEPLHALQALQAAAERPFYATVGVTDLAVGALRDYVADVQSRVRGYSATLDLQPKALRDTAVSVVTARVDELSHDAQARRAALEKRVAELQDEARTVPTRVQSLVDANVELLEGAYGDLVKRGESLVGRIRRQQSTQDAVQAAETTVAKARTTKTQATKAATSGQSSAKAGAKKATSAAKKRSATPRSSAKATTTAAKKTGSSSAKAATDAAAKVGD